MEKNTCIDAYCSRFHGAEAITCSRTERFHCSLLAFELRQGDGKDGGLGPMHGKGGGKDGGLGPTREGGGGLLDGVGIIGETLSLASNRTELHVSQASVSLE